MAQRQLSEADIRQLADQFQQFQAEQEAAQQGQLLIAGAEDVPERQTDPGCGPCTAGHHQQVTRRWLWRSTSTTRSICSSPKVAGYALTVMVVVGSRWRRGARPSSP